MITINTNIKEYSSAVGWAARKGIRLNIINGNDFELIKSGACPNYIISHTCHQIQRDFPNITCVGPQCDFPGVKYYPEFGFNKEAVDISPSILIPAEVIYVNRLGDFKSKVFIKKIESLGFNLKVFGNGFGISEFKSTKIYPDFVYKRAQVIAADTEEEIYKALYLGKICITPFYFAHCYNVFNIGPESKLTSSEAQQDFAIEYSWESIFGRLSKLLPEPLFNE